MASAGDNSKTALVEALNGALADHLALYVKTKNFHWHVAGPRFRDLHLMFDEQATQIIGLVDLIGERVRKNGAATLTSIGSVASASQIADQDNSALGADAMVSELRQDNAKLLDRLRKVKETSEAAGDHATNGIVDDWIDQAEERVWFLGQTLKQASD
jgi:starvation-inducible DNA-binding protein